MAYSSQRTLTSQLDFCNWQTDGSTVKYHYFYVQLVYLILNFKIKYIFLNQVATQLFSRSWVSPIPDLINIEKCLSAGNQTT